MHTPRALRPQRVTMSEQDISKYVRNSDLKTKLSTVFTRLLVARNCKPPLIVSRTKWC